MPSLSTRLNGRPSSGHRYGRCFGYLCGSLLFALWSCEETPPPVCEPLSCDALGAECGFAPDGCGALLLCGTCSFPQTCGGDGLPQVCRQAECLPTTCLVQGAECGSIVDGCGLILDCGSCAADGICGGTGVPNRCGSSACTPSTCTSLGLECGTASDRCAAPLDCGDCTDGNLCTSSGKCLWPFAITGEAHLGWGVTKGCIASGCHDWSTLPLVHESTWRVPDCALCHGGGGACEAVGGGVNHNPSRDCLGCHDNQHAYRRNADCVACHYARFGTQRCL